MKAMKALVTNADDWMSLAAIRSLGRHGVKVTAASHLNKSMGFHSKYCAQRAYYPDPKKAGNRVSDHLLKMVKKNGFDVFLPVGEDALIPVMKSRDRFSPHVKLPFPDFMTMDKADDKSKTFKEAVKAGLAIPKTLFMEDLSDVGKAVKKLEFPVVIKPYRGCGSRGHVVLNSPKNIEKIFRSTVSVHGPSMIQEYINGDKYSVSALFDGMHRPVRVCVHRVLKQFPLSGGPQILSETVHEPGIMEFGLKMLRHLKWYGLAHVEIVVDRKEGKPRMIEINPRVYGSVSLPIAAGVDYPWLLFRMAVGEEIKPDLSYRAGVRCRLLFPGCFRHLVRVMFGVQNRGGFDCPSRMSTLADFFKFYGRDLHYFILSKDDPMPGTFTVINYLYGMRLGKIKRFIFGGGIRRRA